MKKNIKVITEMLKSGINGAELSKKSGINRTYVSMILNGRLNASDEHKKRIADALGTEVNRIF